MKPFWICLGLAGLLGGCAGLQQQQAQLVSHACAASTAQAEFMADRWQQRANLAVGRGEIPSLVDTTAKVREAVPACEGKPALVLLRFANHPWLPDAALPRLKRMFDATAAAARQDFAAYRDAGGR